MPSRLCIRLDNNKEQKSSEAMIFAVMNAIFAEQKGKQGFRLYVCGREQIFRGKEGNKRSTILKISSIRPK